MAYHGYIPFIQSYLTKLKHNPAVLEVGVDRGVTLIPVAAAMAAAHEDYLYVGIDVNIQDSVKLMVHYLGLGPHTNLIQENSLKLLPKMVLQEMTFDVVLLDGDHNYHTVKTELESLDKLVRPGGFAIIDDYDGRWSNKDLWYAERDGYENNDLTTPRVETEAHGVKPAVDEWLVEHPGWRLLKPIPGEPVILARAE